MLLSAEPLEHLPRVKVLPLIFTAEVTLRTRIAAPPRSGPVRSQRLRSKTESCTRSRPPRTKTAPPPPPS